MASDPATVAHVLDQIAGAGEVSARKMFGEYAVYLDGKVIALICDDRPFFKATPGARALLPGAELAQPYAGAKPHLAIGDEIDTADVMVALARAVWADLPVPKPKKPRRAKR